MTGAHPGARSSCQLLCHAEGRRATAPHPESDDTSDQHRHGAIPERAGGDRNAAAGRPPMAWTAQLDSLNADGSGDRAWTIRPAGRSCTGADACASGSCSCSDLGLRTCARRSRASGCWESGVRELLERRAAEAGSRLDNRWNASGRCVSERGRWLRYKSRSRATRPLLDLAALDTICLGNACNTRRRR